jgi:GntR family transcriptional regulator
MELKYQTVFLDIQNKIISGYWPEDSMIPTELELCRIHNVSRITVRRALDEMVQLGLIRRTRGKGSFVKGAKRFAEYKKGLISQDGLDTEVAVSNKIIEIIDYGPQDQISRHLQSEFKHDGEGVSQFRFVKLVEDQPYALMSVFLTSSLAEEIKKMDIAHHNFIELITIHTGKPVKTLSRSISAIIPDEETCRVLNVKCGSAHLWMKNIAYFENQDIAGISYGVYNGNVYDFAVNINLNNPPRGLL